MRLLVNAVALVGAGAVVLAVGGWAVFSAWVALAGAAVAARVLWRSAPRAAPSAAVPYPQLVRLAYGQVARELRQLPWGWPPRGGGVVPYGGAPEGASETRTGDG